MITRRILILFSLLIIGQISFAQKKHISEELKFAEYLGTSNQYDDQVFVLKQLLLENKYISTGQKDSIHYLLGRSYYQKKILDSSIIEYSQVSQASNKIFVPAVFWKGYLESHTKLLDQSRRSLLSLATNENKLKSLQNFELAGNTLLSRNYDQFDQYEKNFTGNYFPFAQQEIKLKDLKKILVDKKHKSPALAGILSTIIPGSGKIYGGKVGQGIATIMATTLMGLQTYESYRKDGSDSPRFIVYASLLSSFYIANVWGSILSVKVRKREFNDTIDQQILLNMHIPLRTIFN